VSEQTPEQPPVNPYQPSAAPPVVGPTGIPYWAPDHPETTTVLLLGILGMATCQLIAPFAWVKGSRVKKEIEAAGGRYGGRQQVQVGYVLGIVGSCLLGLYALGFLLYAAVAVVAISSGS
jgi:hypothetical protein